MKLLSDVNFIIIVFLGLLLLAVLLLLSKYLFSMRKMTIDAINQRLSQTENAIDDVRTSFQNCRIVPYGHVIVPLDEGFSQHTLASGYVLKIERQLEHRAVAEAILGRKLAVNERVHHIYGLGKNDNRPENLCVIDIDAHDVFHSYLRREKELKGKYPSTATQRRILKDYFGGILLKEALSNKVFQFPPIEARPQLFADELPILN